MQKQITIQFLVEQGVYNTYTKAFFRHAKHDFRNPDSCWIWKGQINKAGYGYFNIIRGSFGAKKCFSHRASWIIHNGDIPEGLSVCHHCDNPPCWNPKHLWVGTNRENNEDKERKGSAKSVKGIEHGMAILTEEQVRQIMFMRHCWGIETPMIAHIFRVNVSTISKIVLGKHWRHLFS